MSICNGIGPHGDHCCYLEGKVCQHLIQLDGMNRCGLRVELGSWGKVHTDPRYLQDVKPILIRRNVVDCGDYGIDPPRCCFAK